MLWNIQKENSTKSLEKGEIDFIKQEKYFNYSFGQNVVTSPQKSHYMFSWIW